MATHGYGKLIGFAVEWSVCERFARPARGDHGKSSRPALR